MESFGINTRTKDGILQITEVWKMVFLYNRTSKPIAQYVGIYLLGAYYKEYCPNNNLIYLRPKFPKVRRTYHQRKRCSAIQITKFRKTFPRLCLW